MNQYTAALYFSWMVIKKIATRTAGKPLKQFWDGIRSRSPKFGGFFSQATAAQCDFFFFFSPYQKIGRIYFVKHRESKETSSCVRNRISQSWPSVSGALPGHRSASHSRNCLSAVAANSSFSFEVFFVFLKLTFVTQGVSSWAGGIITLNQWFAS